jgi:hypothetical protein
MSLLGLIYHLRNLSNGKIDASSIFLSVSQYYLLLWLT